MPFGAVSPAMTSTERAVWEKTDSTIMTARCHLTDQEHTACFVPNRSNVQYDGYIVQSNRSFKKKKKKAMCLCDCKNQQMG